MKFGYPLIFVLWIGDALCSAGLDCNHFVADGLLGDCRTVSDEIAQRVQVEARWRSETQLVCSDNARSSHWDAELSRITVVPAHIQARAVRDDEIDVGLLNAILAHEFFHFVQDRHMRGDWQISRPSRDVREHEADVFAAIWLSLHARARNASLDNEWERLASMLALDGDNRNDKFTHGLPLDRVRYGRIGWNVGAELFDDHGPQFEFTHSRIKDIRDEVRSSPTRPRGLVSFEAIDFRQRLNRTYGVVQVEIAAAKEGKTVERGDLEDMRRRVRRVRETAEGLPETLGLSERLAARDTFARLEELLRIFSQSCNAVETLSRDSWSDRAQLSMLETQIDGWAEMLKVFAEIIIDEAWRVEVKNVGVAIQSGEGRSAETALWRLMWVVRDAETEGVLSEYEADVIQGRIPRLTECSRDAETCMKELTELTELWK